MIILQCAVGSWETDCIVALAINAGSSRGMGSGAVSRNVLTAFAATGQEDIVAMVPKSWNLPAINNRVRLILVAPGTTHKVIAETVSFRGAFPTHGVNRLFSLTDTSMPFCPVPHLLLVQQAYLTYRPSEWGFQASRWWALRFRAMDAYFRLGLRSVTLFTVQTHTMKARLADRWNIDLSRIEVVPSSITPAPRDLAWDPQAEGDPYVFFPAHGNPHKNHVVLADMLGFLSRRKVNIRCRVTISEDESPRFARRATELSVLDRIDFLGRLPPSRVWEVMAGSLALVNPSKLESFPLTYQEAMTLGCPVVAADKDFSREACGEAAIYCDADDGECFGDAVMSLVESASRRKELSELGRARARESSRSWPEIAGAYRGILERM